MSGAKLVEYSDPGVEATLQHPAGYRTPGIWRKQTISAIHIANELNIYATNLGNVFLYSRQQRQLVLLTRTSVPCTHCTLGEQGIILVQTSNQIILFKLHELLKTSLVWRKGVDPSTASLLHGNKLLYSNKNKLISLCTNSLDKHEHSEQILSLDNVIIHLSHANNMVVVGTEDTTTVYSFINQLLVKKGSLAFRTVLLPLVDGGVVVEMDGKLTTADSLERVQSIWDDGEHSCDPGAVIHELGGGAYLLATPGTLQGGTALPTNFGIRGSFRDESSSSKNIFPNKHTF